MPSWTVPFAIMVRVKQLRSLGRRATRRLLGWRKVRPAAPLPRAVPKTVWLYWDTGEAMAPPLVRACIASWRRQNRDWEVRVLDRDSVAASVEMPLGPGDIPVQAYSDLLRLRLLSRHGGVWADATLFCLRPLDAWLPPLAQYGFFAYLWTEGDSWFIWPNEHRVVTSWFLASAPGDLIMSEWERKSFDYWQGRKTPHTYYWVHLIFEYLLLSHLGFRRAVAQMPKLGAYGAHLVHDHVMRGGDPGPVRRALAGGAAPVQKLRWNWPPEQIGRAAEVLEESLDP